MRFLARFAPVLLLLIALPVVDAAEGSEGEILVAPRWTLTVDDQVYFADNTIHAAFAANRSWDFGDGSPRHNTTTRVVDHGFHEPGTYIVNLTVERGGITNTTQRTVEVEAARPLPFTLPAWLLTAMPFTVAALLTGLSFLVLLRGQPTIYNRVFFALYLTSAFKSVTDPLLVTASPAWAAPLKDLNYIAGYFLIALFIWFVLVFPRPVWAWLKMGARGSVTLLMAVPFLVNHFFGFFGSFFFNVYVSIMALAALGILVYHAWETDSREERHRIQLLSVTFFILVFSTVAVTGIQYLAERAFAEGDGASGHFYLKITHYFVLVFIPALEVLGSFILMYGILRYQAMGVELFVKRITRGAFFAASIFATFVIVGNTIEFFFEETILQGRVPLGFLVAGFVAAFAMYPVQKVTEKLANKLFPHAGSTAPDYLSQRRMEIYEAQLRYALLDGTLKQKELGMLHSLRESLQIQPEEVRKVASLFPGVNLSVLLKAPVAPPRAAVPTR